MKRLLFTVLVFSCLVVAAHAGTITVTSTADGADPGPAGSLRKAVNDAGAGDTIQFSVTGTIALTSGQIIIMKDLTIAGPGAGNLTISGNNTNRMLLIGNAVVNVSGLTFANGLDHDGGGIYNAGTTTITNCTISNNHATGNIANGSLGGGIYNGGTVNVINSTLSGNSSPVAGGAIIGGTINITGSTLSGNTSLGYGGALAINGTLHVTNSTLSGNTATGSTTNDGGGAVAIYDSNAVVTISSSTITNNSAPNTASGVRGGIWLQDGTLTLVNSIVVGNSGADLQQDGGEVISSGYNILGASTSAPYFDKTGDQTGVTTAQLKLGALATNGGPTKTHALLAGSPAINAGSPSAPTTDQRGYARNGTPDIGAFEFSGVEPVLALALKPALVAETAGPNASTGTVARSGSTTNALTINLASSNPARVSVPSSVVVPAGKSSITFPIAAHDNTVADGPEKITISAASSGYVATNIALTITDNEAHLGFSIDKLSFAENAGTNAATGTLTRNTTTTYPLVVKIDNGNKHKLNVPVLVTIPAGTSSVTFPIGAIDNSVAEGPQSVKLTARAKFYPTTSTNVTVLDNEAQLSVTVAPATFSEGAGAGAAMVTITRNTIGTEAITLLLTSSNTGAVTLPPHVILAAGAKSVSVPLTAINNGTPNATQSVTLTATAAPYGYASGSAVVMVTDDD